MRKMGREEKLVQLRCLDPVNGAGCEYDKLKLEYRNAKEYTRESTYDHPDNPSRVRLYADHRKRIAEPEKAVDNNEPLEPNNMASDMMNFNGKLKAFQNRERENIELFLRIKHWHTGNGMVDRVLHNQSRGSLRDRSRQLQLFRETHDNCYMYRRLKNVKSVISRKAQMEWFRKQQSYFLMGSKYPPFWAPPPCAEYEKLAFLRSQLDPAPIVWMDFEVCDLICGRVFFELRPDACPVAAENFRTLCSGEMDSTYRCHHMERVVPGLFWRAGGQSPDGGYFPTEVHKLKHDEAGILSMVGYKETTHNTEFMISAKPLPSMDNINLVIGRVIEGMDFLNEISSTCEPYESGRPRIPVMITNCGQTSESEMDKIPPPKLFKELREEALIARGLRAMRRQSGSRRKTGSFSALNNRKKSAVPRSPSLKRKSDAEALSKSSENPVSSNDEKTIHLKKLLAESRKSLNSRKQSSTLLIKE